MPNIREHAHSALDRRQFLAAAGAVPIILALPGTAKAGVSAYKLKAVAAPYKIDPARSLLAET